MIRLLVLVTLVGVGRSWSHEMENNNENNLENHRSDYEAIGHGHPGSGSAEAGYYSQGFHQSRPESYHYVDMTYQEEPPFYHHHRPSYHHQHHPYQHQHESFPWHWLVIAKALFWKIKFFTLLKFAVIAFFKIPFFLILFVLKILFFVKLLKLAKLAIIVPILLPLGLLLLVPLIPLLLAPLLLLPLLIPLLLLLPIPALTPPTAQTKTADQGRDKTTYYSSLSSLRSLLETDECIERIACRIAPTRMTPYTAFMSWALDKMVALIRHPKLKAYVEAYKNSSTRRSGQSCAQVYRCNSLY